MFRGQGDGLFRLDHGAVDGLGGGGQFLQQRVFGVSARLPRPGPRMFDSAQGGRQLLRQLVPAEGGAGVSEVGDGLFRLSLIPFLGCRRISN